MSESRRTAAPPPRRRLAVPVVLFAWVSLLNEVSAQMVAPLIPVLLAGTLAAGPVALGVVEGAADAVAAFVKLWSGRRADAAPERRRALVLWGYGLAIASRPLIGVAGHWGAVAALRSLDRLGKGLRGAPRDAMLAEATPADMRGRAYGLNRGMDYAGAVAGTLVAAAVLGFGGVAVEDVIVWSALPGLGVLALLAWLPAPRPDMPPAALPADGRAGAPGSFAALPRAPGLTPELRGLLVMVALFGLGRASEAFIVLRGHGLGLGIVELLLLWAWLAALQSAVALAASPWTDRVAKRRLVPAQWAALAVAWGGLATVQGAASLWLAVSVYGVLSGIGEGVERALVSELADPARKGTAFGWYHMLTGAVAIPGGLLFGGIWHLAGAMAAFGWAAAAALACALAFPRVVRGGPAAGAPD